MSCVEAKCSLLFLWSACQVDLQHLGEVNHRDGSGDKIVSEEALTSAPSFYSTSRFLGLFRVIACNTAVKLQRKYVLVSSSGGTLQCSCDLSVYSLWLKYPKSVGTSSNQLALHYVSAQAAVGVTETTITVPLIHTLEN